MATKMELSVSEAVTAVKELLGFPQNKGTQNTICFEKDGKTLFLVSKQYLDNNKVIGKLKDFFKDKSIVGGQCLVDRAFWSLFTVFYIEAEKTI